MSRFVLCILSVSNVSYHDAVFAARAAIGSGALALLALVAVHLLKRDLDPSRTMISRYALGPYGWLMALCFAAWAAASLFLFGALTVLGTSTLGRIGLILLLVAGISLVLAAVFPMDPVGTPRTAISLSGKMHGLAFSIGLPCLVVAPLILSLTVGTQASHAELPLVFLTAAIWLGLIVMIAIGVRVGPDHGPNPHVPRLFGWANRLLMVAYGVWLMVAAWPLAH